MILYYLFRMQK